MQLKHSRRQRACKVIEDEYGTEKKSAGQCIRSTAVYLALMSSQRVPRVFPWSKHGGFTLRRYITTHNSSGGGNTVARVHKEGYYDAQRIHGMNYLVLGLQRNKMRNASGDKCANNFKQGRNKDLVDKAAFVGAYSIQTN